MTFDEGYGGKPEFLRQLDARGQAYLAEVPRTFTGWLNKPYVTDRSFHRGGRGRGRAVPRLGAGSAAALSVEQHLNRSLALKDQTWTPWRIKDTQKGPMVWETKHVALWPKDDSGLPAAALHLIVARNVRDVLEVKFFLSNAPLETPLKELLHVAFSRWRVERCFEDQKTELGFDHFEGRSYVGLMRHQAITAVSHLFLSETQQQLRGEKSGVDRLSGADRGGSAGAVVEPGPAGCPIDHRGGCGRTRVHPAAKRSGPSLPHQKNTPKTRGSGHHPERPASCRMEHELAL
jgi:SRSO17 transposase